MIRRPPRSTLFPTRRSSDLTGEVTFFGHTHHQGGFSYQDAQLEVLQIRPRAGESLDRKSTRLNSSHGYISYAVFCLKKKKHCTTSLVYPNGIFSLVWLEIR